VQGYCSMHFAVFPAPFRSRVPMQCKVETLFLLAPCFVLPRVAEVQLLSTGSGDRSGMLLFNCSYMRYAIHRKGSRSASQSSHFVFSRFWPARLRVLHLHLSHFSRSREEPCFLMWLCFSDTLDFHVSHIQPPRENLGHASPRSCT
jgi:hypothetical protein